METKTTTTESTSYYIFKTNNKTGETWHICNGSYDTEAECYEGWRRYSYGVCDGFEACLEETRGAFTIGEHKYSLRIQHDGRIDVEFFMLLNKEGQDLIYKLCNL